FARITGLNRHTVRMILQGSDAERRLRNFTVHKCANALGLTVNELRTLPLERLLLRMAKRPGTDSEELRTRLYEEATQPELRAWLERSPERARQLTDEEMDELLSLQGTGGPLTSFGVEHFVEQIERKRKLLERVHAIAGTEYLDFLEQFVSLVYEKIQPYGDRV